MPKEIIIELGLIESHRAVETLEAPAFGIFLNQLGAAPQKITYGKYAHGSNVEYETRITVKRIDDNPMLGEAHKCCEG